MLPDFGSNDVIGHVTIRPEVGVFLFVPNWHQPCILYGFRDIEQQIFWGHDLDRLGSRDVIGHVTIRLAVGGLL